jgi:hypothetical protein
MPNLTPNSTAAPPIPALLADRFAFTYADFVTTLETSIRFAPQHPAFAAHAALQQLQNLALPLLRTRLAALDAAMPYYRSGDPAPLLAAARAAQTLSRDLDGFDLNINRSGNFVREKLTFTVMAAYQVVTAAGAA